MAADITTTALHESAPQRKTRIFSRMKMKRNDKWECIIHEQKMAPEEPGQSAAAQTRLLVQEDVAVVQSLRVQLCSSSSDTPLIPLSLLNLEADLIML